MNIESFLHRSQQHKRTVQPLTIGWSGGWRYETDLTVMTEAWGIIARRFPEVRFVVHGWAPEVVVRTVPAGQLVALDWSDIFDYPSALRSIDIGCCTVADTPWNRLKTCIKWYEMSMAGAACVASHVLYGQEILDGHDGLLATTTEQWVSQLERLITDSHLRRNITLNAQYAVREAHNLATVWPQWLDAWSSILKQHADKQN